MRLFLLLLSLSWFLTSGFLHAQTTQLRVDSANVHQFCKSVPPPDRYLPTVYLIQDPGIQKTIGLTDDQRPKILAISQSVHDEKLLVELEQSAPSLSEFEQVPETRQRRSLEVRAARLSHLSQRMEHGVLTASQFHKLNQLRIRLSGMVYFLNTQSDRDLSLSSDQRKLILDTHSRIMRRSNLLSVKHRDESKARNLTGKQKLEDQKLLNSLLGELELQGVEEVLSLLAQTQRLAYERLAGPPTDLRRETLFMTIPAESPTSSN